MALFAALTQPIKTFSDKKKLHGLFSAKRERSSEFGIHERTDFVEP